MKQIALIEVVNKEALQEVANEYYGGDLEVALKGELAWVEDSGISISLIGEAHGHPEYIENCYPHECWRCAEEYGTDCKLDMYMPCSPDCEYIDVNTGEPMLGEPCEGCDAAEVYRETELCLESKRHP